LKIKDDCLFFTVLLFLETRPSRSFIEQTTAIMEFFQTWMGKDGIEI